MAKSLQDQLRKSGLVSDHKARKARSDKRKSNAKQRASKTDESANRRAELEAQRQEQIQRDRELNQAKQSELNARALQAQILQLVDLNEIPRPEDGEHSFNYVADGKVKHIYVDDELHKALSDGRVALVGDAHRTAMVPVAVAEKIAQRDASKVLLINSRTENTPREEDDPYADFKVPDDLMW